MYFHFLFLIPTSVSFVCLLLQCFSIVSKGTYWVSLIMSDLVSMHVVIRACSKDRSIGLRGQHFATFSCKRLIITTIIATILCLPCYVCQSAVPIEDFLHLQTYSLLLATCYIYLGR
ncbi:hypothetical protein F5Y02DRAFT_273581 [Annulohypoxylon stygium]|nr:hypothetical protein F5Y02DRAFT_273581 [Annulohypoxylon stygium]